MMTLVCTAESLAMRSLQAVPFHSPSARPEIIALSGPIDVSVTVTVPPETVVNVWVAALF